jgi:hypothetical protein
LIVDGSVGHTVVKGKCVQLPACSEYTLIYSCLIFGTDGYSSVVTTCDKMRVEEKREMGFIIKVETITGFDSI